MAYTTKNRFSTTAFAIAATACAVLHCSMLMGFDQLATNGHNSPQAANLLAKTQAAKPAVTLERVVITTRRA